MSSDAVQREPFNPFAAISEANPINIATVITRRWLLIAIGAVVGIVGGIGYYLTATVKYESTAQVLVEKKDARLPTRGTENSSDIEARVSEDMLATHMQIVQSPQVVGAALEKCGLDNIPSVAKNLRADQDPTKFIRDRLTVSRGGLGQAKSAHVLNLALRHTDPEECQKILAAIVDSYRKFLGDTFQDVSLEAVKLISEAKDELAGDLAAAENSYEKFREQAPLLWKGDESANIHRVNYEQLQASLAAVKLEFAEAKSRFEVVQQALAEMDKRKADPLERLALLDEKHITRLELMVQVDRGEANSEEFQARQPARLEDARAHYAGLMNLMIEEKALSASLGAEHPQIQDLRQKINTAKDFLQGKAQHLQIDESKEKLSPEKLIQAYLGLLRFDMVTLEGRQKKLEALAAEERDAAKKMISFELNGENLRKQVTRKQALYDAVIDRLREINLVKEYGGFVTEVIDEVQLGKRVSPLLPLSLFGGLVLGLVLGGGLAVGAELLDTSFHGPDEIRELVGAPILTHVPRLNVDPDKARAPEVDLSLVAFHRPRSREAEVFRGLRTSLFFSGREMARQVVLCTSANPGDGKTTMLCNLAISIAQVGRRTLLIDADMRRPRMHKLFGCDAKPGLADAIAGEIEPLDAVQPSKIGNLSLMSCGTLPENPAELLSSESFNVLLKVLREHFDYVLIDCPPVLAVADPCIVAQQADAVILGIRTARDTRSQVQQAVSQLTEVGAQILGSVVNVADEFVQSTYGYGRYSYGYGYHYGYGYNRTYKTASSSYYDTAAEDETPRVNLELEAKAPVNSAEAKS